jgi:hypothetical protein
VRQADGSPSLFKLNEAALRDILEAHDIRHLPVSIVSIAGQPALSASSTTVVCVFDGVCALLWQGRSVRASRLC